MSHTMPRQKPYRSEQTVVTPPEFIESVLHLLGLKEFYIDLAATKTNAKAKIIITPNMDSLRQEWCDWIPFGKTGWLNPPYSDIRPWVQKAYESQRSIAMLVPASVGSNWWRDWVHEKALVLFLNGRIQFVGHPAGYPKDLALLLYARPLAPVPGYDIWRWK